MGIIILLIYQEVKVLLGILLNISELQKKESEVKVENLRDMLILLMKYLTSLVMTLNP